LRFVDNVWIRLPYEEPAMSREALSLEISQVVSRVVGGETVDVAERGAVLAQKYPDLGMTGEMIGEAIRRAAGMVGMIRSGGKPPPEAAAELPAPSLPAVTFPVVSGHSFAAGDEAGPAPVDTAAREASAEGLRIRRPVAADDAEAQDGRRGSPREPAAPAGRPRRAGPVGMLRALFRA
jgi:hypothetical protein